MAKSRETKPVRQYGRGTGVPDPVDVHVGNRIRGRRLFLGMNQESLAKALGLTFQQVQKYEGGANRVSASRLWEIAAILKTPLAYFFPPKNGEDEAGNYPQDPEGIELVRLYYQIADPGMRQQLFDTVKRVAQKHARARPRRRGA